MADVKGYKVYNPLLDSLDRDGIPYLDMASTFEGMDVDELFESMDTTVPWAIVGSQ